MSSWWNLILDPLPFGVNRAFPSGIPFPKHGKVKMLNFASQRGTGSRSSSALEGFENIVDNLPTGGVVTWDSWGIVSMTPSELHTTDGDLSAKFVTDVEGGGIYSINEPNFDEYESISVDIFVENITPEDKVYFFLRSGQHEGTGSTELGQTGAVTLTISTEDWGSLSNCYLEIASLYGAATFYVDNLRLNGRINNKQGFAEMQSQSKEGYRFTTLPYQLPLIEGFEQLTDSKPSGGPITWTKLGTSTVSLERNYVVEGLTSMKATTTDGLSFISDVQNFTGYVGVAVDLTITQNAGSGTNRVEFGVSGDGINFNNVQYSPNNQNGTFTLRGYFNGADIIDPSTVYVGLFIVGDLTVYFDNMRLLEE